jgi:murein DD-endopeptidase / murein LD-carboxypeptidase
MGRVALVADRLGLKPYGRVTPMLDARLDLSQSPIKIPERFYHVCYDQERYPGAPGVQDLVGGANCQHYAYEFLRAFGYRIPDFRSSDLWADPAHTVVAPCPEPFELVLVHHQPDPWGAHVGVYLGKRLVLHLSQKIGVPALEPLELLTQRAQYRCLIGFKRVWVSPERAFGPPRRGA